MRLENRYFVVKLKDLPDEIPPEIRHAFLTITQYVKECRQRRGKQPLDCIVVEKHWPEYQLALDAIAHRVGRGRMYEP